jgi:putative tricarboxylic transport membrane protein
MMPRESGASFFPHRYIPMTESDIEIVVEDPDAPAKNSPSVTNIRTVDMVTSVLLAAFAALMAFDNWRTGMSWSFDGPQAGYLPFYLSVILGGASLYGLVAAYLSKAEARVSFVTRDQLRRVLQVFVPTLLFILGTQWLGIYVASFLLVVLFMRYVGHIAWWKCLVTSLVFTAAMFITFDVAFDVIMPKGPLEAAFGR